MTLIDGALVWKMKATHGLPLDMALVVLAKQGMVPTWDRLFDAAEKDGTNIPKLIRECQFYVKEAYFEPDAKAINSRLDLLLLKLQKA